LNGSGNTFDFQVGINNNDSEDRIQYDSSMTNASIDELGVDGLDFTSKEGAQSALAKLDDAQFKVNGYRASLGAIQNRLQSTADNLGVMYENISAANSRIRDTDVAAATSEMTRNSILLNANTSVLGQANSTPQLALKLLG
jgi:flagellin